MRVCIIIVLSLWMDLTSGVMNIQLIPQYPVLGEHVIGGSVTLSVTGITGRILTFRWYKGPNTNAEHQILTYVPGDPASQINGSLYFSRARPFPNGSLLISDLHPTDSGNYIVNVQTERSAFEASVTLTVYDLISYPKVIASTSLPIENDPFTLTCDSSNAEKIHWTKDRVSLPSGPILSADHRTVTFPNVTRADSGEYRCEAENPISKSISDPYRVTVCFRGSPAGLSAGVTAGIICGTILGIVLIVSATFLLYMRYVLPVRKEQTGSSR